MLFIDSIGGGLIFPILPELFTNNKYGLILTNTYLPREILYSLSLALFPLTCILSMPIMGAISDKYGRKNVILYGLGGLATNYLLTILSISIHNVWLFLLSIILSGMFSGIYSVGYALISNISANDTERIMNFKLSTLASILGFIVGPGLSVLTNQFSIGNQLIAPFIFAFILSVANITLLRYCFRRLNLSRNYSMTYNKNYDLDILTKKKNLPNKHLIFRIKLIFSALIYMFSTQSLRRLALTYLLFSFGFGLFSQSLSLHLAFSYHYLPSQIGKFFTAMAVIMMISMYLLHGSVNKRIHYTTQIKLGLVSISLLLISKLICTSISILGQYADHLYTIWGITALYYLLIPFITLGFTNLFANSVNNQEQGKIMGSSGQISLIAFTVSGLIIGQLLMLSYKLVILLSSLSYLLSYIILQKYLSHLTGFSDQKLDSNVKAN